LYIRLIITGIEETFCVVGICAPALVNATNIKKEFSDVSASEEKVFHGLFES